MAAGWGKKIKITNVAGWNFAFHLSAGSATYAATWNDPTEVYPGAPHSVTLAVGSQGICYFTDAYLAANGISQAPENDKYPLSLDVPSDKRLAEQA